jgi:hypothetical protein
MPRIRTIKPEFWTSEQVAECSPNARLLFIGLWNFCDDGGVHPANAMRAKMQVFPADGFSKSDIQAMIDELVDAGLLVEYEVDGKAYWRVTGWKHQKIDQPTYRHPQPNGDLPSTPNRRRTPDECSPNNSRANGECSPQEGKGKGEGSKTPMSGKPDSPAEIFAYWQQIMGHPRAKLDAKRRKKINDRLNDGYTQDDLRKAIEGCRKSPHHMGENDRSTVYDGLELICRDAEHVDRFIAMAEGRGLKGGEPEPRSPSQRRLN